ncbi:MAG TPA: hypothetical protein VK681_39170 [Reyranella sp.]|nr:hypothetical protein [Reyranella sp.]
MAETAVRERPILFSSPMVRAILDGTKTQTRRVAFKDDPRDHNPWLCEGRWQDGDEMLRCPYGQPGDHLWVRESFFDHGEIERQPVALDARIEYKADPWDREGDGEAGPWKPSIHMPRWASRLTLEITAVRVERLQEISETDAQAEGIHGLTDEAVCEYQRQLDRAGDPEVPQVNNRDTFHYLWDSINAKRGFGWATNPWVWVIEFRAVAAPEGTNG